jgi:hypothetical protein
MWYLAGYAICYLMCRISNYILGAVEPYKPWTISDRVSALKISLLSWVGVFLGAILIPAELIKSVLNPWIAENKDKPASW